MFSPAGRTPGFKAMSRYSVFSNVDNNVSCKIETVYFDPIDTPQNKLVVTLTDGDGIKETSVRGGDFMWVHNIATTVSWDSANTVSIRASIKSWNPMAKPDTRAIDVHFDSSSAGGSAAVKRRGTWTLTARKTKLADGSTRALYRNSNHPGQLRIKRMVTRKGVTRATYIKP